MTIAEEVRQLASELVACERRAAEIRQLLDEIAAACQPAVVKRLAPEEPPLDPQLFLRALAAGPRQTADLMEIVNASRNRCMRALRSLEAQFLVTALGSGSGLRWHLTDLGVERLTGVASSASLAETRTQLRAVNC